MRWLTDDPDVLSFVLDAVETWSEGDVGTTSSSDEPSEGTQRNQDLATPQASRDPPASRAQHTRGNRREEIEELRALADVLEKQLMHHHAKLQLEGKSTRWQQQAHRELFKRRQSERRNAWLRYAIARHLTLTRRFVQSLKHINSTPEEPPALDFDPYDFVASTDSELTHELPDSSSKDAPTTTLAEFFRGASPSSVDQSEVAHGEGRTIRDS